MFLQLQALIVISQGLIFIKSTIVNFFLHVI